MKHIHTVDANVSSHPRLHLSMCPCEDTCGWYRDSKRGGCLGFGAQAPPLPAGNAMHRLVIKQKAILTCTARGVEASVEGENWTKRTHS